jgi:hypothetical protein
MLASTLRCSSLATSEVGPYGSWLMERTRASSERSDRASSQPRGLVSSGGSGEEKRWVHRFAVTSAIA